jgi:hypothetical protein
VPKVDYKKTLKTLYGPSARAVVMVDVPAMNFLMIDGQGSPGESETYREAVEALYPMAYTLKFMLKRSASAIDYGVMPLEGLWWADDMGDFIAGRRERWKWTLMIMQPEFITTDMVATARAEVARKKNPPALPGVRFECFAEGSAAQILHIGSYADEGPTIQAIHQSIADAGHRLSGKHHEIYLGDPRRTAPEKLKTILRQPFRPA